MALLTENPRAPSWILEEMHTVGLLQRRFLREWRKGNLENYLQACVHAQALHADTVFLPLEVTCTREHMGKLNRRLSGQEHSTHGKLMDSWDKRVCLEARSKRSLDLIVGMAGYEGSHSYVTNVIKESTENLVIVRSRALGSFWFPEKVGALDSWCTDS